MSEKTPNELLEKLKSLGVKNFKNPSPQDIKIILDALIRNKELDISAFINYMNFVTPQVKVLFEGLQTFAQSQEKISKSVLDIIKAAIDILGRELEKELSIEERKEIRDKITELIKDAKEESDKQRKFYEKLAYVGGGVVVVAIGAGLFILTKGKSKEVLIKGVQMVGKAI